LSHFSAKKGSTIHFDANPIEHMPSAAPALMLLPELILWSASVGAKALVVLLALADCAMRSRAALLEQAAGLAVPVESADLNRS